MITPTVADIGRAVIFNGSPLVRTNVHGTIVELNGSSIHVLFEGEEEHTCMRRADLEWVPMEEPE